MFNCVAGKTRKCSRCGGDIPVDTPYIRDGGISSDNYICPDCLVERHGAHIFKMFQYVKDVEALRTAGFEVEADV